MAELSIKADFSGIQRQLDKLSADMVAKVVPAALNKVVDKAKAEMTRQITSEFAIKASEVRMRLQIIRARRDFNSFIAILRTSDFTSKSGARSLNVIHFGAKQVTGKTSKKVRVKIRDKWVTLNVPLGGGVSVKIKKAGGRKIIAGAFIGNDGRTVFIRETKDRLPIKAVQTIDVPQMFNTRKINLAVLQKIGLDLPIEFDRAINAAISGNIK